MKLRCFIALVCLCCALAPSKARADPPQGYAKGPVHDWFQQQKDWKGDSCCSISDGHVLSDTQWRIEGSSYQIRVAHAWWDVPKKALIHATTNPVHAPVAWYYYYRGGDDNPAHITIYCFLPWATLN